MELATQLWKEAAAILPRMQSTVDPSTARTLVGGKTHPNVALAASGLGLHRGLYKNPSQAMRALVKAFPGSISAAIQKNPSNAKAWQDRFTRFEELMATVYAPTQDATPAGTPVDGTSLAVMDVAAEAEPRSSGLQMELDDLSEAAEAVAPPEPPPPPADGVTSSIVSEDEKDATPHSPKAVLVREELTRSGGHIKRTFRAECGSRFGESSSLRAASSPEGETADARARRLDAERHAAFRARGKAVARLEDPEPLEEPAALGDRSCSYILPWRDLNSEERDAARKFGFEGPTDWNRRYLSRTHGSFEKPTKIGELWLTPWRSLSTELHDAACMLGYCELAWQGQWINEHKMQRYEPREHHIQRLREEEAAEARRLEGLRKYRANQRAKHEAWLKGRAALVHAKYARGEFWCEAKEYETNCFREQDEYSALNPAERAATAKPPRFDTEKRDRLRCKVCCDCIVHAWGGGIPDACPCSECKELHRAKAQANWNAAEHAICTELRRLHMRRRLDGVQDSVSELARLFRRAAADVYGAISVACSLLGSHQANSSTGFGSRCHRMDPTGYITAIAIQIRHAIRAPLTIATLQLPLNDAFKFSMLCCRGGARTLSLRKSVTWQRVLGSCTFVTATIAVPTGLSTSGSKVISTKCAPTLKRVARGQSWSWTAFG